MKRGKQTCKILKEIRKQIAAENDIELVTSECTYQGDCLGTCPKCEAEVRYLERELEKRQRMGKAAVFAGMSLGTLFAATSCDRIIPQPLEGDPAVPDTIELSNDSIPSDTIPDEPFLLEGDVLAPEPDSIEADAIGKQEKKTSCPSDMLLEIVGGIEVDDVTEGFVAPEVGEVENSDMVDVYMFVEQMPEFPGGQEALDKYIKENYKFAEILNEYQLDISGRIFVYFIVETDGSISNVKVLRGLEEHFDEEAVRVVKSMPHWIPGKQNGQPVRVAFTLPVIIKW